MGADKSTILKQAQIFTSRGQYDKAIAEWQKLMTGTHADATVHNTIGDLQVRRHSASEAIEAYLQGAASYKACGDPLKAIAVYRKVLKLDPNRLAVYQELGDLNAERGLVSSAIGDYTILCKLLHKAGRTRDALQVYRKMAQTDPGNVEVKQRIAELCVQEAMPADAVEAYLALGQEYQNQRRRDEAQRAYDAAHKIDPNSVKVEKALQSLHDPSRAPSRASDPAGAAPSSDSSSSPKVEGVGRRRLLETAARQIQAGEYTSAEAALMDMLSREPGDPEVCRLLARLHLKRGELNVAMGEFQFLAGAAMRAEEYTLAESMLTEYLGAQPRCAPLIESLAQVYEHKGDVARAVARYGEALSLLLERPDPDQPTLPGDLLSKLKELAPGSELVNKFSETLKGGAPPSQIREASTLQQSEAAQEQVERPSETVEVETALVQAESASLEGTIEPLQVIAEPEPPVPDPVETTAIPIEAVSSVAESVIVEEPQAADSTSAMSVVPDEPSMSDAASAEPVMEEPVVTVTAPSVTEDELRARYELGVAYKDMGLFDEAFEEFRQTITVKPLFLDSCCMMADCFKEQGAAQAAIMHYEQALTAAREDEERATEIRYELGLLYESEGLVENAVQIWSAIGSYRDAGERLERIKVEQGSERGSSDTPMVSASGNGSESTRLPRKRRVSYL